MILLPMLALTMVIAATPSPVPADPLAALHVTAAIPAGWSLAASKAGEPVEFRAPSVVGDAFYFQSTDAKNMTIAQAVTSAQKTIGSDTMAVSKPYRVCNGTQDGWYLETPVEMGMVARSVVVVNADRWTVATYIHLPQFGNPDVNALHTLDSVCLK